MNSPMTPEQIDEIVADYCMVDTSVSGGFDDVSELIAIINLLQEQNANYKEQITALVKEKHTLLEICSNLETDLSRCEESNKY